MFPHDICLLSFLESQYGESEEPMGDEDYDEYSKELNQYRRSKDGRGRGGQGAGAQEVMSWGWGRSFWQLLDLGAGEKQQVNAISLLCRVKSRPWPGFPRSRERDGPGSRPRWQPRRNEQGWNER